MKKSIKHTLTIFCAIICMAIVSCSKESGTAGPQGPQGAPGVNGNANVIQISFGSKTIPFMGTLNLTLPGIDRATADKSMILAYGKSSNGLWYQLPGTTSNGDYTYRTYLTAADPTSTLGIKMTDGLPLPLTGEVFLAMRILVIPANNLVNPPYDISNYESVRQYYNLPE